VEAELGRAWPDRGFVTIPHFMLKSEERPLYGCGHETGHRVVSACHSIPVATVTWVKLGVDGGLECIFPFSAFVGSFPLT
jgi:hypothetical protein